MPGPDPEALLGRLLVRNGILSEERLRECLRERAISPAPRSLGDILVSRGYLTEEQLRATLSPSRGDDPASPARAGRYVLESRVGAGGMGEVWKAHDPQLGRAVALKFLKHDDPEETARFLREAQTAARLSHPNIAAIYEAGRDGGRPFIAMQLIDGQTLKTFPRHDRRRLVALVRDAALAVDHAHALGIVHRDLKPENLMVDGSGRLFVMDFGLAKQAAARSSLSASGLLIGTPAYMSPEQARGDVRAIDARSDVYALGATLYELLADRLPFTGEDLITVLTRVVSEEPAPLRRVRSGLDADVETIVLKCLEKDPSRRYATARALAEDLDRWLAGDAILARPASIAYRARKFVARRRGLFVAGSLAAVAVAGAAALLPQWLAERRAARDAHEQLAEQALFFPLERRLDALRLRFYQPGFRLTDEIFGEYEKLIGDIEDQMRRNAESAHGRYLVGRCCEVIAAAARADAAYARALEINPRHAPTLLARGRIWAERALIARVRGDAPDDGVDLARRAAESVALAMQVTGRTESMELDLAHAYLVVVGRTAPYSSAEARTRWRNEPLVEEFLLLEGMSAATTVAAADEVLARAPSFPKAHYWRAGGLRHQDLDAAISGYTRALDINPRFLDALLERGYVRYLRRDHAGAIDDFTRAIAVDPASAFAWNNRGLSRRDRGELDEALRDFTHAIELAPGLAAAYCNRGVARAAKGDLTGAREDFDAAIGQSPNLAAAYANRCNVRTLQGDLAGALEDGHRAVELNPQGADGFYARAMTRHRRGDLAGALDDCARAFALDPRSAVMCASLGMWRYERGDSRAAIDDLTRAIELGAGDDVYNYRGLARLELGDAEGAVDDFNRAIDADPASAVGWSNRGLARYRQRDLTRALEDFTKALSLESAHAKTWYLRGRTRYETGDMAAAIDDLTRAVGLDAGYVDAWNTRGLARHRRREFDLAIDDFTRAIELAPGAPDGYTYRANARSLKGDRGGAVEDWRRALRVAPPEWPGRREIENVLARLGEKP